MKSPEVFLSELNLSSRSAVVMTTRLNPVPSLSCEVRQAANRGLAVFPVPEFAKLTGKPEFFIGEATSDISRLEEWAAEHPSCTWHGAVGLSRQCVVRIDGMKGRVWFAAKNEDQADCRTLSVERGDTVWAIFRWPAGLVLRSPAKALGPGVKILAEGSSFPIPPSGGSLWTDPWAEIEAVPYWMREIAFEPPDNPPGKAVPPPSARPLTCRPYARVEMPQSLIRKGHPCCNHAGWRGGFRLSRRR
jgi:hypothetical protein